MFLRNKNILLISPEPWEHLFVSKHHYSIALANQGNRVFFLNPPSSAYSIASTQFPHVVELNYTPFVRGLRFLPYLLQYFFFRQKFAALQQLVNTRFDIVWSFDNSVFFDFSFLSDDVFVINHIVDYSQNFQFSKASSSADLCLGVSNNVVERLKQNNPKSFKVSHGYAHLMNQSKRTSLPGNNAVKALYAGNLDSRYLDKQAFSALIENNPSVDFVFAGSGTGWIYRPNVHYLGKIDRAYLMNYMVEADVLLLLYDYQRFPEQLTNAHKILEYLAAGKVTVSNYFSDYHQHRDLLLMYQDRDELLSLFASTVKNLSVLNSPENNKRRKEFALHNTYADRIIEIEKYISDTLTIGSREH